MRYHAYVSITCPSACDADICMIPHMLCDTFGYLISCILNDDVIVEGCDDCALFERVTWCLSALTDMFLLPLRGRFHVCQGGDVDIRLSSPACTYWHMLSHCHFPIWNCSIVERPDDLASVVNESCTWSAYEMSAWIYSPLLLFTLFRFWFLVTLTKVCHLRQLFFPVRAGVGAGSRPRRPTWKSTV